MADTLTPVRILRNGPLTQSESDRSAEAIALGLLGVCELPVEGLSANATWQNGSDVLVGRAAISAAICAKRLIEVRIEDVVSHGKAAAVSGRLITNSGPYLFCHMIKYTNASAKHVASIVSFRHKVSTSK